MNRESSTIVGNVRSTSDVTVPLYLYALILRSTSSPYSIRFMVSVLSTLWNYSFRETLVRPECTYNLNKICINNYFKNEYIIAYKSSLPRPRLHMLLFNVIASAASHTMSYYTTVSRMAILSAYYR